MIVTIKCGLSEMEIPKEDLEALMALCLRDINLTLMDGLYGADEEKLLRRWKKMALLVADVVE